jgi:hypothetical protein
MRQARVSDAIKPVLSPIIITNLKPLGTAALGSNPEKVVIRPPYAYAAGGEAGFFPAALTAILVICLWVRSVVPSKDERTR